MSSQKANINYFAFANCAKVTSAPLSEPGLSSFSISEQNATGLRMTDIVSPPATLSRGVLKGSGSPKNVYGLRGIFLTIPFAFIIILSL